MKISLTHKILLVVAIPLAIQLIFIAIMSNDLSKLAAAQNREQYFVKDVMARDRYIIYERQRTVFMGMYISTLDESMRRKYYETVSDAAGVFNELANLWSGDAERSQVLNQLWQFHSRREEMTQAAFQHMEQKKNVEEMMGGFSAHSLLVRMMLTRKIPYIERFFVKDQEQKLRETEAVEKNANSIYVSLFIGLGALLLASLLSGLLFSFSISRRLKIVLSNIDALANNQASLVKIKGGDEISMLNAAVIDTATRIRDAEEFQAQTIAIIAEELNKPLTEVDAALQQLPKNGFETLSEKGVKRLHDSSAEIRRLESLVFELVNSDAAGRKLDIVQVDLAEMATNCLKIVEPLTKLKSISIKLDGDKNSIAFADGEKTTQVLINLLSNAIKYSPEKSTIEIVFSSTEQEIKVSVRDQGPGIPNEFHSKIFQRYEQAHAAGGQKAASSGLGLKISKEIIESQGGSIGFASRVGEGSTFWFSLPTTRLQLTGAIAEQSVNRSWKATLWKKALLVVALPILVQLITVSALFNFLHQNSERIAELEKITQITSLHEKLMTGIARAGLLAMMYNLDQDQQDLASMRAEGVALRKNVAELERVTASDNGIDSDTAKLLAAINAHIAFEEHIAQAKQNADVSTILGVKGSDKKENLLIDTHTPLQELTARQNKLIASNALASEEIRHNFEMLLFASAIAASIVAAALGLSIAKSLTSRAKKLAVVALEFSEHKELPEPLADDDELAFVEQQLYTAGRKLMELEVLRAEMIGITSHELRTPLTSLFALIELIEAGVFGTVTEQGEKLLAKARLETSDLIVLITNLLDLEKMESGKILVMKQKMRVESVFDQIKSDNVQPANNKGISLTIQNCEQEILGDSGRLSQALTAIIRSILERIPTKSDVLLKCKKSHNNVILALEAPHGVAVKGYNNKHRELAREQMAISLARLTALQHGGNLQLITSSKGRMIEISLPIGA